MSIYLDCNATAPMEPEVRDAVIFYMEEEFGNAGSRTHDYGARAKQAVENARRHVAAVVEAASDEIVFTSGATESNNIALLGLAEHGERTGKRHLVTTAIEHKAVLEPLERLQARGFELTIVPVGEAGAVNADDVLSAVRDDTLLVSVMHVNNETGVKQPVEQIADGLTGEGPFFHIDAAQSFGKDLAPLQHSRVDLISASAHKLYGPKGVGALVVRKRGRSRAPLMPLIYGGGQERGLRPGTLPVHLAVGMGKAAEVALRDHAARAKRCREIREQILEALAPLGVQYNGDQDLVMPHVLNCSIPEIDSEAAMLACKGSVAISNGSACTSTSYTPSHVLEAMGLSEDRIEGAIRLSWCHMTPDADWQKLLREPLETLL